MRTRARAAVAAAISALWAMPAAAEYPERALRIVVPFAPGGNIDITARIIAPGLSELLGQSVVVDNRGGAGGRLGTEMVARAAPDGYTLLMGSSGALTISPTFAPNVPYDPLRDLAPTSLVNSVALALVVHPSFKSRSLREFIALAKASPGRITLASAGSGTNSHLAGELFQLQSGTKFIHVPYKGGAPALIDVMGGQVEFTFDQLSSSVPFIRAGKIRALGITALERSALLPEVPTIHEAGLKGFEASTYTGIMLPGATPKDIVQKIQGTLVRVLDRPATKEAFAKLGADVLKSTPEEFSRKLKADLGKWAEVKKRADIRID
jgi:tripartite-type tricarboxylate transporter receptor subunit TctC